MDRHKIHETLKNKTDKLEKLSDAIVPDFDHDATHKLRVEVKKLRAFLRLIDTNRARQEIKIPKEFKRLYHIAGAIRDAQLEQKKITSWQAELPLYADNLSVNIQRQKEEWKKHYSKKTIKHLLEKIDDHRIETFPPHLLHQFFTDRIESMHEICSKKTISDNQVHAMRKQVKDMLYNAKFAEKKWKKGFEKLTDFPLAELDTLSTVIGDYNDARLMLEHLSSFSSATMEDDEKNAIINICNDEKDRLLTERKKVLARIRKFLKAVKEPLEQAY